MSDNLDLSKIIAAGGVSTSAPRAPRQKGRNGKSGLLTYHERAVLKQFRVLAAEQDRSQQALMAEALNMLFARYGKAQIA